MVKIAIMFDFDGTIFNTMGAHADLAAKAIKKHFGMEFKEARANYLRTAGIAFPKQLEKIFPKFSEAQRKICETEYVNRRVKEVYGTTKPFKDVEPALKALKAKGFDLIISSSTEVNLIDKVLQKHGLRKYFSGIYS